MKTKIVLTIICQIGIFFSAQAQMDTVVSRYREYLFRTHQPQPDVVDHWATSLNTRGQWTDIDYEDKERADWKVLWHLKRARMLTMAWSYPQSQFYHDKNLKKKIDAALNHWLEKRYRNPNWWHNEIGVPQYMRDIIILLRDDLSASQLQQALAVMSQLRVQNNGVGANLMWSADLGLHYGALTGDSELVSRCRELMLKEIKIHTGEGIQPDNSFHQHGKRLQMFQYGKAFLWETVRLSWQLRETSLAFPEEKVDILTDFLLEGWQWMARSIHTVPGTMDRSSSRIGELRSPDLRPLIPFIIELQPERAAAFKKMAAIQNGEGALTGFRYYPHSDFSAYHRPGFSFFLKTISTRTLPTESINSENLKGRLLNSGDGYLIRNGEEYFNLMPVWDWTALPGITAFKGADHINRKFFVGSVSSGASGLSAMDYQMRNKERTKVLSARKFWAFHNDVVICLIAGLEGKNIDGDIYTALDQSRWQSDVTVNKPGNVMKAGSHNMTDVEWIHHAGFAYIPLQPAAFDLRLQEVSGTWESINASIKTDTVTETIFLPVMLHNIEKSRSAGYALALCETPEDAKKLAKKPAWEVLRNDEICQAVQFDDGTVMAAFFSADQLKIGKKKTLKVDQPCLVLIENGKLYASDPSHEGKTVACNWAGKTYKITLPKNDFTTEVVE